MGIFDFFKKAKDKKEIDRIFHKIKNHQDAKNMVNKALSYRNLGQNDKAIDILIDCEKKYPFYASGRIILGTTLRNYGKIEEAEAQFHKLLKEYIDDKEKPLQEIYANLGILYYYNRNDVSSAMKYYRLALEAPRPENIESNYYDIVLSNIHRDLCMIFFHEGDEKSAKKHAIMSLNLNKNNYVASKIYGLCLVNEFTRNKERIKYVVENIENKEITEAVNHLKANLSEDPKDCTSLYAISLSLYYLTQMKYYNGKPKIYDIISAELKEYSDKLEQISKESERWKECYDMLNNVMTNFGIEVLRAKGFNVEILK